MIGRNRLYGLAQLGWGLLGNGLDLDGIGRELSHESDCAATRCRGTVLNAAELERHLAVVVAVADAFEHAPAASDEVIADGGVTVVDHEKPYRRDRPGPADAAGVCDG
ncbi:hypothetical protein C479_02636 [Halovivax asiaticus JCM 14624]|uniref:Uncharacterized protein n=1 Tax=Halovivax asiaticus JCM 14624 TaxID=1227490 RepID=M0BRS6_9EURY|nr:hypothetical protein [Halovivax asiaticus]ELZ13706.1 hypothetical protein C479_02636 [Halovivax asiaticus JCM 14624]